MVRRFECTEDGSSKFWEISVQGLQHTVTFGRVGASGQSKVKEFASDEAANKDAEALIRSKLAKGYVEIGKGAAPAASPTTGKKEPKVKAVVATASSQAPTIPPIAPSGPTRAAKRAQVHPTGDLKKFWALYGGRVLSLSFTKSETATLAMIRIHSSAGSLLQEFALPTAKLAGATLTAKKELVFVCNGSVYAFGAKGEPTSEPFADVESATYLSDGTAVIVTAKEIRFRTPQGATNVVAQTRGEGFRWPEIFTDDTIAILSREKPYRLLVLDKTGATSLDVALAGNNATQPARTPDGRIAVASGSTLHVFGPGGQHSTWTLSGRSDADILTLPDGWIAVPIREGTVDFFSPTGERVVFRRDPPNPYLCNQEEIAGMADGTVIAPATDGTLYRLTQNGQQLGSYEMPKGFLGPVALDDGSLVVSGGKMLHFLGAADFTSLEQMLLEAPDLSADKKLLIEHFSGWALTAKCQKLLVQLLGRLVEVVRDDAAQSLRLGFYTDERELYRITFGPAKPVAGWPQSYRDVSALHGTICNEANASIGVYFGECTAELSDDDLERFRGLCDADQNWLLFDTTTTNALGEPTIVLFNHGMEIDECRPFPGQNKEAFGVGGVLIRSWARRIFSTNDAYAKWGLG